MICGWNDFVVGERDALLSLSFYYHNCQNKRRTRLLTLRSGSNSRYYHFYRISERRVSALQSEKYCKCTDNMHHN